MRKDVFHDAIVVVDNRRPLFGHSSDSALLCDGANATTDGTKSTAPIEHVHGANGRRHADPATDGRQARASLTPLFFSNSSFFDLTSHLRTANKHVPYSFLPTKTVELWRRLRVFPHDSSAPREARQDWRPAYSGTRREGWDSAQGGEDVRPLHSCIRSGSGYS